MVKEREKELYLYQIKHNDIVVIECEYELLIHLGSEVKLLNTETGNTFNMSVLGWEELIQGIATQSFSHKVVKI